MMVRRTRSLLVLSLVLLAAACWAQDAPRRIAGDVVGFENGTLTVRTAAGAEEHVKLLPNARVTMRSKADVDHLATNRYVGVTAAPRADGTLVASEIQVFPESMRGTGEGHRPMEGAYTMTNATVSSVARSAARSTTAEGTIGAMQGGAEPRLTLAYKGGEKTVVVPPDTVVYASDIGDPGQLKPGAHVIVYATTQPDGSLATARVSVGTNGYVPPR